MFTLSSCFAMILTSMAAADEAKTKSLQKRNQFHLIYDNWCPHWTNKAHAEHRTCRRVSPVLDMAQVVVMLPLGASAVHKVVEVQIVLVSLFVLFLTHTHTHLTHWQWSCLKGFYNVSFFRVTHRQWHDHQLRRRLQRAISCCIRHRKVIRA